MKILFRMINAAVWLGFATVTPETVQAGDLASIFTNVQPQTPAGIPRRSSIILIEGHGLGFGDLSCYGQTNFQTPNLDRIAAEGIRFTHYTAGLGTNFEGQHWLFWGGKTAGAPAGGVAQVLKDSGYTTAFLGEWLADRQPQQCGFEEFAGFLDSSEGMNYYSDYLWRRSPHTIYSDTAGKEPIYPNMNGKKGANTVDYFFKVAMNYIRLEHPSRPNHFRPFFLVLNLPTPRSARTGADEFPVVSDAPYSEEPWPQAAKNRAALLGQLDANLGQLLEQLNKYGMTNNVAIFVSSSGAPETFANRQLDFFHAAADVRANPADAFYGPMLVRWPDHIPPGQVSDAPWSAVDFLPTAAAIGFVKPTGPVEGRSVLPVLLNRPDAVRP